MARPQTDIDAVREELLTIVEEIIRARGAVDITLYDLATQAGMSPSNIYRFFESKEALMEAVAEKWFADKITIMEEVVNSDVPIEQKLYDFFARRYVLMSEKHRQDPDLFVSYCELGNVHFEVVRGYVDLADHYLAMVVAEASGHGYFAGLSIDDAVSLINMMIQPYCDPHKMVQMQMALNENKLRLVINTILLGLKAENTPSLSSNAPPLHQVKLVQ
ncbi:hypothetical protein LPB140_11175 [Sphingorhabdus lutea]|uniref:HTH tetR-type domain-containing protein n=1 Tax=Sphingorhabdus lutea TaxID=1913578 RepID=A0A1L3JDQ0_9SPHN|nr:TetR family transcriptional regulator [Sphingorhabdus lutea]APG63255.1 hypothetical protein LPB140_11175 [Sphingorhabdus lutea]